MRGVGRGLLALTVSAPAWAWTPGEPTEIRLDGAGAAVVPFGDDLLLTGPRGTWLLGKDGAVRASSPAVGGGAVAHDLDGDGRLDALLCGASGVSWLRRTDGGFESARPLTTDACRAAILHGDALVTAGDQLIRWPLEPSRLGEPVVLDGVVRAAPLLASAPDRLAVADRGAPEIVEYSERGRSSFGTGGPVGGLAADQGWVWSLPDSASLANVRRESFPVAPSPGLVRVADVDGDGRSDRIVAHGSERIGVLRAGDDFERVFAAPSGWADVVVAEVDGDGCRDLVFATPRGAAIQRGKCAPLAVPAAPLASAPADGTAPEAGSAPPPSDGGAGAPPVDGSASAPPPVAASTPPAVDYTRPPPPIGADRELPEVVVARGAKMQVHAGERLQVRLVSPSGAPGVQFAGRGGPTGLVVLPDGQVRYDALPEHVGDWHVSIRMWGGSQLLRVETIALEVLPAAPSAPAGAASDPAMAVAAPPRDEPRGGFGTLPVRAGVASLDACLTSFGVAGGASYAGNTWERVGQTAVMPSISPAAAVSCEVGLAGGTRAFFGADTAPTFTYLAADDVQFVHLAAGTAGILWGGERFRAGPYGTMGILVLGGGLRMVWLPFGRDGAVRQGIELRATALWPSTPAGEAMVLYSRQVGHSRRQGRQW